MCVGLSMINLIVCFVVVGSAAGCGTGGPIDDDIFMIIINCGMVGPRGRLAFFFSFAYDMIHTRRTHQRRGD